MSLPSNDAARAAANKRRIKPLLDALCGPGTGGLKDRLADVYHPDAHWRGSHPLNEMSGLDAIESVVWGPLFDAFPDLERRDTIFIGGTHDGRDYVGAVGHYCGTFRRDWLTIPATGRPIYIRYGEFHEVRDGKIAVSTVLIDVLDVMRQAGFWPIAPSLGTEEQWPGPITADGVSFSEQDAELSARNIEQTLAMHASLGNFDDRTGGGREGLMTMPQIEFWHDKMMWYGPAGIGTTRGLQGFVDYHQLPFRQGFPNRRGGNHYVRFGDGAYSATGGWPSIHAEHEGGTFLGLAPTGRKVTMRVMDFYLHHEGLIRENWVPLDIIDLLNQLGVDVFDRMRSHFNRGAS